MAQQLATLCQTICAAAADIRNAMPMSSPPPSETALVRHVIDACQNAIKQAVTQPSRVNGLLFGLQY
ncbi:MAG: hypothetical protein KF899_15075 [Parvibaculum sp.]|nr:hypothetical protein [Parvibaculum sp.]